MIEHGLKLDDISLEKGFMWVYRSGKYHTDRVIILYEYQKTRKAEHPQKFLEGFHGVCVNNLHHNKPPVRRE